MSQRRSCRTCALVAFSCGAISAVMGAAPQKKYESPRRQPAATPTAADPQVPAQTEQEKRFEEMLTGAVLEGTWRWTGPQGFSPEKTLRDPQPEKYTITSVSRGAEDLWIIHARIQYGQRDVTVPVPVRVLWAGDTPVITVDALPIPLLGTYSARVLVHEGFYSGVWYSGARTYGGVLSGRIYKETAREPDEGEKPAPARDEEPNSDDR